MQLRQSAQRSEAGVFEERRYTVLWRRGALIALSHAALDLAPDGIYHARELGKEAVASVLYDASAVLGDSRLRQFPEVGLDAFVGPLLVSPH